MNSQIEHASAKQSKAKIASPTATMGDLFSKVEALGIYSG